MKHFSKIVFMFQILIFSTCNTVKKNTNENIDNNSETSSIAVRDTLDSMSGTDSLPSSSDSSIPVDSSSDLATESDAATESDVATESEISSDSLIDTATQPTISCPVDHKKFYCMAAMSICENRVVPEFSCDGDENFACCYIGPETLECPEGIILSSSYQAFCVDKNNDCQDTRILPSFDCEEGYHCCLE